MEMTQRLSQFIETMHISIRSFEQTIGASNGVIRKAISNGTDIQSKWVAAIAENFPQLNIKWLLTGEGEMSRVGTLSVVKEFSDRLSDVLNEDFNNNSGTISILSNALGIGYEELMMLQQDLTLPASPLDFVRFCHKFPEINFNWIVFGYGEKYIGPDEKCIRQIRERLRNYDPDEQLQQTGKLSVQAFWKQIAFQNEQLKEKDAQIKQLLSILRERTH